MSSRKTKIKSSGKGMRRPDLYMNALDIVSNNLDYTEVCMDLSFEEQNELDDYIAQIKENQKDEEDE